MNPEAILYTQLSKDIGLKFLTKWRGLLSFGMHVIIPSLWVIDSYPFEKP